MKPDDTLQKILFSTTSRFVGEFESDGILITHAWPSFSNRLAHYRMDETPISRSAYILAFRTARYERKPGVPEPDYEPFGDLVAALASVLYGKRFDTHGSLEMSGRFGLPDLTAFSGFSNLNLAFNSHHPRADLPVPLNLTEMQRLVSVLWTDNPPVGAHIFHGACRFYLRALQNAELDPEVAYLNLITAGEILSNAPKFKNTDVLDSQAKTVLSDIENGYSGGAKAAKIVRGRLRQVKRLYVGALMKLQDPSFFERREAKHEFEALKANDHEQALSAAYDLRSRYLHTGITFGGWVRPGRDNAECQLGRPVVVDKEMAKILYRAPTFCGLERLTRYALLKFGQSLGIDLTNLDPSPIEPN
jgi:Apea-like HEPN